MFCKCNPLKAEKNVEYAQKQFPLAFSSLLCSLLQRWLNSLSKCCLNSSQSYLKQPESLCMEKLVKIHIHCFIVLKMGLSLVNYQPVIPGLLNLTPMLGILDGIMATPFLS